jgi:hypothetical protein
MEDYSCLVTSHAIHNRYVKGTSDFVDSSYKSVSIVHSTSVVNKDSAVLPIVGVAGPVVVNEGNGWVQIDRTPGGHDGLADVVDTLLEDEARLDEAFAAHVVRHLGATLLLRHHQHLSSYVLRLACLRLVLLVGVEKGALNLRSSTHKLEFITIPLQIIKKPRFCID